MSLYERLSLLVSIAGFAAVITSVVLLLRQTRALTLQTKYVADSLKSSVYGSSATQMFAVDQLFINHSELRPYFYEGKVISEDDQGYNQVMAIAEYLLDFFGSVLLQKENFPELFPSERWVSFIKDVFANSPVLCSYLAKPDVQSWYTKELIALMNEGSKRRQKQVMPQQQQPGGATPGVTIERAV